MLKIVITVTDENLDFATSAFGVGSFDIAEEKLAQFRKSYEKRVAMELKEEDSF